MKTKKEKPRELRVIQKLIDKWMVEAKRREDIALLNSWEGKVRPTPKAKRK